MRQKGEQRPLRMVILITQLGINMLVPIFICAWLGVKAVELSHMEILFPCFLLLGILAGFRTCYMTICRFASIKHLGTDSPFGTENGSCREQDLKKNGESDENEMDKMDTGDQRDTP